MGKPRSRQQTKRRLDAALDLALAQTFPASDPVAIGRATATEAPARPVDRKPPVIEPSDVAAAAQRAA
jgi:hypothetical protein